MFIERMRRNLRRRAGEFCLFVLGACGSTHAPAHDDAKQAAAMPAAHDDDAPPSPAIHVAANDSATRSPIDATPSPDGARVYYLAFSTDAAGESQAGVFATAADGGKIDTLASGPPLLTPVGITISLDGKQLFIADAAAGDDASGGLFALAADGGAPSLLSGTAGYRPAGVTIAKTGDDALLYFTGRDPNSGQAGVFSVAPSGGAVRALHAGDDISQPGGVTVSGAGDVYIADVTEDGARVLRVHDDAADTFVDDIGVGFPAGITLTHDDRTLLVSGLDPDTKHDLVYFVDVASKKLTLLRDPVAAFSESAGLHRAHDRDLFAWADSEANATGTVYVLEP